MTGKEMMEAWFEEIEALQKARTLLEKIYSEVGPYGEQSISGESVSKLNAFFKFDDS